MKSKNITQNMPLKITFGYQHRYLLFANVAHRVAGKAKVGACEYNVNKEGKQTNQIF